MSADHHLHKYYFVTSHFSLDLHNDIIMSDEIHVSIVHAPWLLPTASFGFSLDGSNGLSLTARRGRPPGRRAGCSSSGRRVTFEGVVQRSVDLGQEDLETTRGRDASVRPVGRPELRSEGTPRRRAVVREPRSEATGRLRRHIA